MYLRSFKSNYSYVWLLVFNPKSLAGNTWATSQREMVIFLGKWVESTSGMNELIGTMWYVGTPPINIEALSFQFVKKCVLCL